jgi:hypothetical protein
VSQIPGVSSVRCGDSSRAEPGPRWRSRSKARPCGGSCDIEERFEFELGAECGNG